jgi:hypothetical protein
VLVAVASELDASPREMLGVVLDASSPVGAVDVEVIRT